MRSVLVPLGLLLCLPGWPGRAHGDDNDLARVFWKHGVNGTLVLSTLDGKTRYVHNATRAAERYTPVSTFKIPNTAIALEEGAASGERQVFKWDGKDRGRPEWNRDHTLESAFKVSCVWCYRQLARKIGPARYRAHLSRLGYGNAQMGRQVDAFWLDGSLRISALEQVEFLRKLKLRKLGFKAQVYEVLERLMVLGKGPQLFLRGKTGWSVESRPQLGWVVGYLEKADAVWLFALNMDIRMREDARKRMAILRDALQAKGVLPPEKR